MSHTIATLLDHAEAGDTLYVSHEVIGDQELGALEATSAQVRGRMAEIELRILQLDSDLQSELATEARQVEGELGELQERRIAASSQLDRVTVRAPQAGLILDLSVHIADAVVMAGEPIMVVVPDNDELVVEVEVNPQDIDQISVGQNATLRFMAFNQRTTPEIGGTILRIPADVTTDQRTGLNRYLVRIATSADELARLGQVVPTPGMPVEAFIKTEDRTALAYLAKPFADQLARAFKDD